MKDSFEQIQILQVCYEISMSIGASLDLNEMLEVCLATFLEQMNCAAGGVYSLNREVEDWRLQKAVSIPQDTQRNDTYQAALTQALASFVGNEAPDDELPEKQWLKFRKTLPLSKQHQPGRYYYIFDLSDFGFMILVKYGEPLSPALIKSLKPLLLKLSAACQACLSEAVLHASLERRARQVQTATEVAQEIAMASDLDELFRKVVHLVKERFGYYYAHIYTLEDKKLVMQQGTDQIGRKLKESGHQIDLRAEKSLTAQAARRGEPALASDVSQIPNWRPNRLLAATKSELAVPIKLGNEVLGVLDVQSDVVNGVDQEDQLLLSGLCGQIAIFIHDYWAAVERKQAEQLLTKRAVEFETVAQVSVSTSTILDTDRLLQEVVDLTKERFGLYHVHIYLFNEAGACLDLAAGAGEAGRRMTAEEWSIPLDREQSLVARAARLHQGVIVNDVRQDPGFFQNPRLPDTRSELAVPLLIQDQLLGVLDVQSDVVDRFTEEDVNLNTILAAQIATALRNALLYSQMQERAERERLINLISQKIQSTVTVEGALQAAVQELGQALRARHTRVELAPFSRVDQAEPETREPNGAGYHE